MILTKICVLFVLLFTSISLCQGAEEPINLSSPQQDTRWPIIERFKAMDGPEINDWFSELDSQTGVIPFAKVQEEISRFPLVAEGSYVEIIFELLKLEVQPEAGETELQRNNIKKVKDLYRQAFCEDYCKRFPDQDKKGFDESMSPFENYIGSLGSTKWNDLSQEEANDLTEQAWGLLKESLKSY